MRVMNPRAAATDRARRTILLPPVPVEPRAEEEDLGDAVGGVAQAEVAVEAVILVGESNHCGRDFAHLERAVVLLRLFERSAQVYVARENHRRRLDVAD